MTFLPWTRRTLGDAGADRRATSWRRFPVSDNTGCNCPYPVSMSLAVNLPGCACAHYRARGRVLIKTIKEF